MMMQGKMITQARRFMLLWGMTIAVPVAVVVVLFPSPIDARGPGESTETTAFSISSPGWRCELQQRRSLRDNAGAGRRLLRMARSTTSCRVIANRFELCEPVYLRTTAGAADDFTAGDETENGKRLCAVLECGGSDADSTTQVLALDDPFGRREVTTVVLDRACIDLD